MPPLGWRKKTKDTYVSKAKRARKAQPGIDKKTLRKEAIRRAAGVTSSCSDDDTIDVDATSEHGDEGPQSSESETYMTAEEALKYIPEWAIPTGDVKLTKPRRLGAFFESASDSDDVTLEPPNMAEHHLRPFEELEPKYVLLRGVGHDDDSPERARSPIRRVYPLSQVRGPGAPYTWRNLVWEMKPAAERALLEAARAAEEEDRARMPPPPDATTRHQGTVRR